MLNRKRQKGGVTIMIYNKNFSSRLSKRLSYKIQRKNRYLGIQEKYRFRDKKDEIRQTEIG